MTTYVSQGPRGPVAGVADITGRNPGKWTVTFSPDILNCNMPYFEVSKIVVAGAPGSTFTMWIGDFQWDYVLNGSVNSCDPVIPVPLIPGQYLYFFWSDGVSDQTPPTVQVWIRYDQDIIANRNVQYGVTPYS